MPRFQDYFEKTKGKPIQYEGLILVMMDTIPVPGGQAKFRVTIESCDSEWRQGAQVWVDKGAICVMDCVTECKAKRVNLWHIPEIVDNVIEVRTKKEQFHIKNIWERQHSPMPGSLGSGLRVDSWINGAAMIIEEIPNGRRYRCNDGHPDEDFDDIIFRIERIEE